MDFLVLLKWFYWIIVVLHWGFINTSPPFGWRVPARTHAPRGFQPEKPIKQNHIAQAQAPGHTATQKGKMDMNREDYFKNSADESDLGSRHLGLGMLKTAISADMANMTPEQRERLNERLKRELLKEVGILKAACSAHDFIDAKRMQSLVKPELHKHVEHLEVPNFAAKR